MPNKRNELIKITALSKEMLMYAKKNNWDNVIKLEKERNVTLKHLFSKSFTRQEKLENDIVIRSLLKVNKELESLTTKERESVRNEVSSVSKGKHAIGMYAQNVG